MNKFQFKLPVKPFIMPLIIAFLIMLPAVPAAMTMANRLYARYMLENKAENILLCADYYSFETYLSATGSGSSSTASIISGFGISSVTVGPVPSTGSADNTDDLQPSLTIPVYDTDLIKALITNGLEVILKVVDPVTPENTDAIKDIIKLNRIGCLIPDKLNSPPTQSYIELFTFLASEGKVFGLTEGDNQAGFYNEEYLYGFLDPEGSMKNASFVKAFTAPASDIPAFRMNGQASGAISIAGIPKNGSVFYIWLRSITDRNCRIILINAYPESLASYGDAREILNTASLLSKYLSRRGYHTASSSDELKIPLSSYTAMSEEEALIPIFILLFVIHSLSVFCIISKTGCSLRTGSILTAGSMPTACNNLTIGSTLTACSEPRSCKNWLYTALLSIVPGIFFLPSSEVAVLAVTVLFPFYSLAACIRICHYSLSANRITGTAFCLACYLLISLTGGLAAASGLSGLEYSTGAQIYLGTYISFTAPLLISAVFFSGCALPAGVKLKWGIAKKALIFAVSALSAYIYLARSGNYSAISASPAEIRLRELLEYFFTIRPRFKEFAVGYPCIMLYSYFKRSNNKIFAENAIFQLLLPVGAIIGSISIINSFCHGYTPLKVSLVRSLYGAATGIVTGAAVILLIDLMHYIFRYKKFRHTAQ